MGGVKKSKYGSLSMPIITLYKLDEATDLSPPPPSSPAAARTADAAVGAHDTDSTRASHLNLRLKPGEKLHAGLQSSKNASDIWE